MDIRKLSHNILRDLYGGSRRLSMYPLGHPITQETLNKPLELLSEVFSFKNSFNTEFFKDRLLAEGILLDDTVYVSGLALDMKKHKINNVYILSHVQIDDLYHFLSILISRPGPDDNGISRFLASQNIDSIAVNIDKPRNLFVFEGVEPVAGRTPKLLEKRVNQILSKNQSIISAYYMGRINKDEDVLNYLNVDFRLGFLTDYFRESLLALSSENANSLLEDIVFSTNWLDDNIDTKAVVGLKRLFDDYLGDKEDSQALTDIYELLKKVGAPPTIMNRLFDQSKVIKLKTFQDSEEIVNTLKFSDPAQIEIDYLKKTVFKLASSGQKEYLFDILDLLMNSLSASTKSTRQQGLNLLVTASSVLSEGGFHDEFASLCRTAVSLALLPKDVLEPTEFAVRLVWQSLNKKRWQELKFLVRMLKGITSDEMQPASKRKYVAARLLEISESNLLSDAINELLENSRGEESAEFLEAVGNLGSKKIIQSLVEDITNPDINIRSRIIKILVSMKDDSAETISQLLAEQIAEYKGGKVIEEKWYYLRNILRILKEVEAEEALPSLEIMSGWNDSRVKLEIIKTLEGMPAQGSAKLLEKLSCDHEYEIKKAAVVAMGLTGHPDMIVKLRAVFERSRDCRVLAVASLGRIGGPRARDVLIDMFENEAFLASLKLSMKEVEEVRVAIIKALSRIGDLVSTQKLEEYSRKKFVKSLFKKDLLSSTAKMVLGMKDR